MKIQLKNNLLNKIGEIADREGYNAYLVGGYVRDHLLGRKGFDIDIMVTGDGIKFAETVAKEFDTDLDSVYRNFETALLNLDDVKLEFATSRKESYQKNSRKPEVEPGTLKEDLSRRDFTINALAVSINKKTYGDVHDEFNGIEDIKNKIIRTPLDPLKTFEDDPLRIMRAIRFASKLNFSIEEKTFEALGKMKERLIGNEVVSQERISNEFLQILMTDKPSIGLELLHKSGVMEVVFPEISLLDGVDQRKDFHHKNVFYHTMMVVDNICKTTDDVWLRFTALVHDIAKPKTKKFIEGIGWTFHGHEELGARMMKKIFRRMKLPMHRLEYVEKLVRLHLRPIPISKNVVKDSAVRRLAADAGEELVDLLKLCRADITSKNPELVKKYLENYEIVEKKIIEVQEKDHLRNFQSPVRGEEIMKVFGIEPGRQVGIIKHKIEEAILEGEIPNEYEPAREYMLKNFSEMLKT
ncbi:MAG TPA: CCA tRNA nucleotidyltransferase [Ignavibacteria bacterium]|nr:CCA tRNA nucleotidyltransferase [Ignavibacteria bacterium]HMR41098.1 CCA tRNA nucleotidyltransferase [Ignavibacteria bacterium]